MVGVDMKDADTEIGDLLSVDWSGFDNVETRVEEESGIALPL